MGIKEKSGEALLAEAEVQLNQDYRENEYPGIGTIRIYHPTFEEENQVNHFYAKEYNRLLKEEPNLPTVIQLEDIIEERGTSLDKLTKQIEECRNKIQDAYLEVNKNEKRKTRNNKKQVEELNRKLQNKIIENSAKIQEIIRKKELMFQGTVEKWAESKTTNFKISLCVKNEKDEPIWKTPEEVGSVRNRNMQKLVMDAIEFWSGMSDPLFVESLGRIFGG